MKHIYLTDADIINLQMVGNRDELFVKLITISNKEYAEKILNSVDCKKHSYGIGIETKRLETVVKLLLTGVNQDLVLNAVEQEQEATLWINRMLIKERK